MQEIIELTKELYRIFDVLNEEYFDWELDQPIITLQKQKPNNYGHFIEEQTWSSLTTNQQWNEINLNPINLDRDVDDIIGVLLHEMVHYYNSMNGINDCSGIRHNKKFKAKAEEVGLVVENDESIGYGITDISDELRDFIDNTIQPNKDAFSIFMDLGFTEEDKETKPRKKTQFKYICPKCGMVAKAKTGLNIVCGVCQVELEMEDDDEIIFTEEEKE